MASSDVNLNIKVTVKEAIKSVDDFTRGVNDSIVDLVKGYGAVSTAVVAAGLAFKKAFDVAEEIANVADETNKINKQFDFLAENAGGSAESLRAAFENVNQGIVDTEEILKSASVALVNLQIPAQDIAKNFEAARKISVGLGVDTVQAFEAINTAIASGNTRALKQVGIFLDANAAIDAYARNLGIASKFLTDAQKEAALFAAIQDKVNKNFGNVDIATKTTSESFKAFRVSVGDVGEAVAIALNKIFGPSVSKLLDAFAKSLGILGGEIMARYGSGAEQAAAKQTVLNLSIEKNIENIERLKESQKALGATDLGTQNRIKELEALIAKQRENLKQEQEFQAEIERKRSSQKNTSQEAVEQTEEQKQKIRELTAAQQEFAAKTLALQAQVTQARLQTTTSTEQQAILLSERLAQIDQETQAKILQSQQDALGKGLAAKAQAIEQERLLNEQAQLAKEAAQIAANERELQIETEKAIIRGDIETTAGLNSMMLQKKVVDAQIAKAQEGTAEFTRLKLKEKALEEQISAARLSLASKFFGDMSSLMRTKNKELFEIGKAAALAQAIVDGAAAVQIALRSAPAPFNFLLAAATGVKTAVNIATIQAQTLAKGTDFVTGGVAGKDSVPALLMPGERVVSAPQNRDLTQFLDGGGSGKGLDETNGLLESIVARLGALENTIVVNIGNKEIVREVREGLRAGRTLTA